MTRKEVPAPPVGGGVLPWKPSASTVSWRHEIRLPLRARRGAPAGKGVERSCRAYEAGADGPTSELDIPAGTADVPLKALAEQTEFLTLFQSNDVEQVRTPG